MYFLLHLLIKSKTIDTGDFVIFNHLVKIPKRFASINTTETSLVSPFHSQSRVARIKAVHMSSCCLDGKWITISLLCRLNQWAFVYYARQPSFLTYFKRQPFMPSISSCNGWMAPPPLYPKQQSLFQSSEEEEEGATTKALSSSARQCPHRVCGVSAIFST